MKIVIAGGTGFIGSYLQRRYQEDGDQVTVISRQQGHVSWNQTDLVKVLDHADLLINLAGHSVNSYPDHKNKELILDSRIESTVLLGTALSQCSNPPSLWINASASAIYSSSQTAFSTESSANLSDSFLAQVVRQWESAFFSFRYSSVRQIALRTSVVLGSGGGAFPLLLRLARLGLGGTVGSGKQMMSWIHCEDYYQMLRFLVANNHISGVVNCTSPGAVTNSEFMKALRSSVKVKIGIFAPEFAVRMASKILNFDPDLVLSSSWLYPEVLLEAGFRFKYSDVKEALKDLVHSD